MKFSSTLALVAAVVATAFTSGEHSAVEASPVNVKVMAAEHRIAGIQYMNHIQFVPSGELNVNRLQARGGIWPPTTTTTTSSSSTTSTATTSSSTTTDSKPTSTPTTTPATTSTTTTATGSLPPHKTPANGLKYWGGPIVNNVEVTMLQWGSGVKYTSELAAFYNGVTQSSWFDVMRQYWTSTTDTIGSGSYLGAMTLTASSDNLPTKKSLDDANDIQPYLIALVKSGKIRPNDNSYFPIHFPAGISITQGGQGSCQAFCAYHGTIDISSLNVGTQYLKYGVLPDQGGSCAGGCGSSSSAVNNLFSVASHELAEMVTDPAVGVVTGDTIAAPAAWYNEKNGENGDLCNAQQGTTVGRDGKKYTVQAIWSNFDNGCVTSANF